MIRLSRAFLLLELSTDLWDNRYLGGTGGVFMRMSGSKRSPLALRQTNDNMPTISQFDSASRCIFNVEIVRFTFDEKFFRAFGLDDRR